MNPDAFLALLFPSASLADLLTHLWQSTAVAAALWLMLVAMGRRLSASTRRTLAWMALAKFALPAAWLSRLCASMMSTRREWLISDQLQFPVVMPATFAVQTPANHPWLERWPSVALVVWAVGFAALFGAWLVRGLRLQRRWLASAQPLPAELAKMLATAAQRVGLSRPPRALLGPSNVGAGTLGVFRPRLLIPCGLAETLSTEEFEAVLLHELVHVQRRDTLWGALQALVVSALWFNPVVWMLHRTLAVDTEKSCDERVLALTGDPQGYAGVLVKSAHHALGLPQPAFAGMATPPIVGRLRNVLNFTSQRERPLARAMVIAAAVMLVALGGHAGKISAAIADAPATPPITVLPPAETRVADAAVTSAPEAVQPSAIQNPSQSLAEASTTSAVSVTETPKQASEPSPSPESPAVASAANTSSAVPVDPAPPVASVAAPLPVAEPSTSVATPARVDGVAERDHPPIPQASSTSARRQSAAPPKDGSAKIEFTITPAGSVSNARVVTASSPEMAALALERVNASRFKPGTKDGRPVHVRGSMTVAPVRRTAQATPATAPQAIRTFQRTSESAEDDRVYYIRELDRIPRPRSTVSPQYPFAMRRAGIAGEVLVEFIVTSKGEVTDVVATRSTRKEFEAPAIAAIKQWRFAPGQKNGRNVNTRMQVPMVFNLNTE